MKLMIRHAAIGLLALLALNCAQATEEPAGSTSIDSVSQALDPQCTELGTDITEHSCFHANSGPFVTVAASATRNFTATTPNVTKAHTHFTVTLPGAAGANEGTVKYVPARTGDFAIYRNPKTTLVVLDAAGNQVPRLLDHAVTSCAKLVHVSVYNFTASATYRLVFGPAQVTQLGVVVERLGEFAVPYYADTDRDTYGNPNSSIATACKPPAGHVSDDTDCNDQSAAIHPGATEIADGKDNDCDGLVDESP